MNKIAVLHVPHEQCEASMEEMLKSVGYDVYGLDRDLSHEFNAYMKPTVACRLGKRASPALLRKCSVFVTVKHYNLPGLHEHHGFLDGKILWFDINGGIPGERIPREPMKGYPIQVPVPYVSANKRYLDGSPYGVSGPRYVCYIPLADRKRFLDAAHRRGLTTPPICLVHNPVNWGYGWVVKPLQIQHQVRFFGSHGAPDGLVPYSEIPGVIASSLCMVHMKGRDCPGCSLYQALLTGCPVIITDLFLRRTLYHDLYIHENTCLVVNDDDRLPIHDRADYLMEQLTSAIERLKDPAENARIGSSGRRKIVQLMWQSEKEKDTASFRNFMEANFR